MFSKSAKAAAVLVFTSGVEDYDMAVKVYDQLEADDLPVQETLDKFSCYGSGVCRWSCVEELHDGDWWEEVTQLAINIDKARQHFGE
jgi:hypothetical protein